MTTAIAGPLAPLSVMLLGLVLGMRHATDPDHVIAVTTIVSRERKLGRATSIGVIWGLGHTVTVLAVGISIIAFKIVIPPRLGLAMEFAVAIVLILLGLSAAAGVARRLLRKLSGSESLDRTESVHSHPHRHGGMLHRHSHYHPNADEPHSHDATAGAEADHHHGMSAGSARSALALRHPMMRAFGVGLVHGLAGSAAIALLVLSAIPEPLWAALYLVVFGIGVIVSMGLITTAIAAPFMFAAERMARLHRGFASAAGLLSFSFGLFLALHIGFADRLFGAAPIWTPH